MTERNFTGRSSHAIVFAAWLIGLGLVFLVRDYAALSWGEAWPLFIVWIGVSTLVSAVVRSRGLAALVSSVPWPLAVLSVGVLFLLSTTGVLQPSPLELTTRWWPVAPLAIGAWLLVTAFWPRRSPPV